MQKIDFYDTVPDPDSEVPKEIRDEFFKRMKSNQSERVRRLAFPATQLLLLGAGSVPRQRCTRCTVGSECSPNTPRRALLPRS